MIPSAPTKRNKRGLSFPDCALGVTVPTSTKPKLWQDGKALCLRKKKAPCKRVGIIYLKEQHFKQKRQRYCIPNALFELNWFKTDG